DRFVYKHEKKAALGAEFNIAIVPFEPIFLDAYKSKYNINPFKGIELQFEEDELIFGDKISQKKMEITEDNQEVYVTQDEQLIITPLPEAFNDEDEVKIKIKYEQVSIPFILKNDLPESIPITGQRIWKLVRENGHDIEWIRGNNRLILGNREFYFHPEYKRFFDWEYQWVSDGYRSAKYESDLLHAEELNLSDNLREAYSRFITYFKINNSIPSLSAVTADYKKRALDYINEYENEIKNFKDGYPAGKKGRDLFKLGTIWSNSMLYFTPFHPLMIAFKLKIYELLKSEYVDNSILNRLNP